VIRCTVFTGGLAAGLALLLAGCSSGGSGLNTDGPFGNSKVPYSGGQCVSVSRGEVVTIGVLDFPDHGGRARIEKIVLADPRDLQLVTAWAVPITGTDLLGVFPGYPPLGVKGKGPPKLAPGVQWGRRQRADGAVISHTPGQDVINLVLVVKASAVTGSAKDVLVDYQSAGADYQLDLHLFMKVFNGVPSGKCSV
jgi:hypothetical protein